MQDPIAYERYPVSVVIVANLHALFLYLTGAVLVYLLFPLLVILYILLIVVLEVRLLSRHCTDCYYYGKVCAFGKGWVSAKIFCQGLPDRFSRMKITAKDLIPDLLVIVIPVLAGIVLLFEAFRWTILILIIVLLVLGFPGNAFVRGKLACRYCRQRQYGCPAAQFFK